MAAPPDSHASLLELADAIPAATAAYCDALGQDSDKADTALAALRTADDQLMEQAALARREADTSEKGARPEADPAGTTPTAPAQARPQKADPSPGLELRDGHETGSSAGDVAQPHFRDSHETLDRALPADGGVMRDGHETGPEGGRLRDLVDLRLAQQRIRPLAEPPASPAPTTTAAAAAPTDPAAPHGRPDALISVPRDPLLRGLGGTDVHVPLEPSLFGGYWVLAGWSATPDVWLVTGEGHMVGWVERGIGGVARWAALYEGAFLGDRATRQPLLHDSPTEAALTVQRAYRQNV
ncbi:hypothetical protein ACFC1R_37115 [Kitasatospora sp. NPDC056138]|uniref:hypothetical protein n=1 Tax=Kitasatospora sp. NPDC056138 TaxID=3345724 RepID=UPI0035E38B07